MPSRLGVSERQALGPHLSLRPLHLLDGAKLPSSPHQHHHDDVPSKGWTLKTWTMYPASPFSSAAPGRPRLACLPL